jgi:hypothetical protein
MPTTIISEQPKYTFRKEIPLLKQVLIMETLRALSPRPLSPYTDQPINNSRKLMNIQMETEDPFSDEHAIDNESSRKSPFRLFGCLRWSLLSIVEDFRALIGATRYPPRGIGRGTSDGECPECRRGPVLRRYTESRTPLWRGGNSAYVPLGKGTSRVKAREVDDLV